MHGLDLPFNKDLEDKFDTCSSSTEMNAEKGATVNFFIDRFPN